MDICVVCSASSDASGLCDMHKYAEQAENLNCAWKLALARSHDRPGSDRARADEQRAYDELIEFIELHDLNYTDVDPRGPDNSVWGTEHDCDDRCNASTCWYYATELRDPGEWANPFPPGGAGSSLAEGY